MWDWISVITKAGEFLGLAVLGAFGGIANYVYHGVKKDRKFAWGKFIANVVVAMFVGVVIGQFISVDNTYRDGYIMASGFCAYPILNVMEDRVKVWLDQRFPRAPWR